MFYQWIIKKKVFFASIQPKHKHTLKITKCFFQYSNLRLIE